MNQEEIELDWPALESNPEVINRLCQALGLRTDKFIMHQLFSTDQWAIQMIPQPVLGLIMLFDESQVQEQLKQAEEMTLDPAQTPPDMFYMKQYAGNACGTIALFHILINAATHMPQLLSNGSILQRFKIETEALCPQQRGRLFEKNKEIQAEHIKAVEEGDSEVPERPDAHFISFVCHNERMYELDGCKKCPVDHGQCHPNQLLQKGALQIKKFMDRDPQNIQFSLMALSSADQVLDL